MLSRLTKTKRWKAAVLLALFYALCTLTPSATFAFGDGTPTAHCLTGDNDHGLHAKQMHEAAAAKVHTHADGTSHVHGQKTESGTSDEHGKTSDSKCCGLMCVSAIQATVATGDLPDLPRVATVAAIERNATGQPPVRLYRPPNSPLSH